MIVHVLGSIKSGLPRSCRGCDYNLDRRRKLIDPPHAHAGESVIVGYWRESVDVMYFRWSLCRRVGM